MLGLCLVTYLSFFLRGAGGGESRRIHGSSFGEKRGGEECMMCVISSLISTRRERWFIRVLFSPDIIFGLERKDRAAYRQRV